MAELNSTQKRKARDLVRERDGDRCSLGLLCNHISGEEYRKQTGNDFDLHHLDRNRANNPADGSNWALACHPCNCKNDPRGKTKRPKFAKFRNLKNRVAVNEYVYEREWEGEKELQWRGAREKSATMKKNEYSEPIFRTSVREFVNLKGIVKRKDLIDACCEKAGCSQATGSRYLDKMASFFGEYIYVGRMDDEKRTIFPIGKIAGYEGEIYVMLKEVPEENVPESTAPAAAVSTNGNGAHHDTP